MHRETDEFPTSTTVMPLIPLLLLTVGAMGVAWMLMPTEAQMAERVLKDRHFEQVMACLSIQGQTDDGKLAELRRLSGRRLATLAKLFRLTPREQLRHIFARDLTEEYDLLTHGLVLNAIQYVDVIPPQEAYDLVRPHLNRIPDDFQVHLLELLGRNAHAVGQSRLAVECYERACASPSAGWTTIQRTAQAFRWENRSPEGAEILRRWLSLHDASLSEKERSEAEALQYAMSLESGQPSPAFDRCLAELKALPPDVAPSPDLLKRAMQAATFSGRSSEVIPWMERFIRSLPDATIPWEQIPKLHASNPSRFSDLKTWWSQMAKFADWGRKPEIAFGWHLRCAALGDLTSLDRCLALHSWLGRTEDCAQLLQLLGPVPGRSDLGATLPRMLGLLGREKEARELFQRWLEQHPEDNGSRFAFACMLEDIGDDDALIQQLEELLRRNPSDTGALKKLSTVQMRKGLLRQALALLEAAPAQAHDDETLEGYAALAESLDQHDARMRALRLALQRKADPKPGDYLTLAEASSYTTPAGQAESILTEGLMRFPDNTALRLAIATIHVEREDYDKALAEVMQSPLRTKFEVIAFILSLAAQARDGRSVLEFLGKDLEQRHQLAPEDRLNLAVLYHKAGNNPDCERLFSTVPETPAQRRSIAEARLYCGDFEKAEKIMLACVQDSRNAEPGDWVFLGDIYGRQGRTEEAQRAYDYSLALLSADLPDTASR